MKILVSTGTHTQDFSRLVMAADAIAKEHPEYEIKVQVGYSEYKPIHVSEHFDFCQKERMRELMDWADVLVLQGGWGGMREAVDLAKRTVVVPRIIGPEHAHDQGEVCLKMESIGCVIGAYIVNQHRSLPEDAFRKDRELLRRYANETAYALESAINKALNYQFKKLEHGSAKIIADTLKIWFN